MINLRARLQAETRPLHQALHHHPLMVQLSRPSSENLFSSENYLAVLRAFYQFHRTAERVFEYCPTQERFGEEAPCLLWLEQDFQVQGLPLPEALTDSPLALLATPDDYLAYLYLKQGSTLGGQVISHRLQEQLELTPGADQFFFYGYGPATHANWNLFLQYLDEMESALDSEKVVSSAKKLFVFMHDCFSDHLTDAPPRGTNGPRIPADPT